MVCTGALAPPPHPTLCVSARLVCVCVGHPHPTYVKHSHMWCGSVFAPPPLSASPPPCPTTGAPGGVVCPSPPANAPPPPHANPPLTPSTTCLTPLMDPLACARAQRRQPPRPSPPSPRWSWTTPSSSSPTPTPASSPRVFLPVTGQEGGASIHTRPKAPGGGGLSQQLATSPPPAFFEGPGALSSYGPFCPHESMCRCAMSLCVCIPLSYRSRQRVQECRRDRWGHHLAEILQLAEVFLSDNRRLNPKIWGDRIRDHSPDHFSSHASPIHPVGPI